MNIYNLVTGISILSPLYFILLTTIKVYQQYCGIIRRITIVNATPKGKRGGSLTLKRCKGFETVGKCITPLLLKCSLVLLPSLPIGFTYNYKLLILITSVMVMK